MTDKSTKGEGVDDEFIWEEYDATWTATDQKRLVSVDGLFSRSLEYHNNVHGFCSSFKDHDKEELRQHDAAEAIEVSKCGKDGQFSLVVTVTNGSLTDYISRLSGPSAGSIIWIHMKDLRSLKVLAPKFQIPELCVAGFDDLRAHSSVLPSADGAMLLSLVTCGLIDNNAMMFKLFLFVSRGVVISYEHELFPDLSELNTLETKDATYVAPTSLSDAQPNIGNPLIDTSKNSIPRKSSLAADVDEVEGSGIINAVISHMHFMSSAEIKTAGEMYIIHEVAMKALQGQDLILEYLSRSLSFFKQKVHVQLNHSEELQIHRAMHMVSSAITRTKNLNIESAKCFNRFVNPKAALLNALQAIVGDHHISYIFYVLDAYSFATHCLEGLEEESVRISNRLANVSEIRSNHAATMLSLIATIFLPLSFLAGVFGMNFEVNGGYTVDLLNRPYGPKVFTGMCVLVFLICIVVFISEGWMPAPMFFKHFNYARRGSGGVAAATGMVTSDKSTAIAARAQADANEVEQRRTRDAALRRKMATMTSVERHSVQSHGLPKHITVGTRKIQSFSYVNSGGVTGGDVDNNVPFIRQI